jgi:hypothetical protein
MPVYNLMAMMFEKMLMNCAKAKEIRVSKDWETATGFGTVESVRETTKVKMVDNWMTLRTLEEMELKERQKRKQFFEAKERESKKSRAEHGD